MAIEVADVKVESNKKEFMDEIDKLIPVALEECGLAAEGYAKKEITIKKAVDTGRLRNSITHATDENTAYIGTNVEYAPFVELGTSRQRAKPYLKPAVTDHTREYQEIIERRLKG